MADSPTWMIDGAPGQILERMGKARAAVSGLDTTTKSGMTYTPIEAVIEMARAALAEAGIVIEWQTTGHELVPFAAKSGSGGFSATVEHVTHWIAPDGSFLRFSVTAHAYSGSARSLLAANTAAWKQLLRYALLMPIGGDDRDVPHRWSAAGKKINQMIINAKTIAELQQIGALPEVEAQPPADYEKNRQEHTRQWRLLARIRAAHGDPLPDTSQWNKEKYEDA